jgi:uncharacterized protein (TIGR02996 family)
MTEQALLLAILDDPHDALRRLAYADWLEDHGEPERAAFIKQRLSPRSAGGPMPGDDWIELLGVPVSPTSLACVWAARLDETIAWCTARLQLRTPELYPRESTAPVFQKIWDRTITPQRQRAVNQIGRRRALFGQPLHHRGDGRLLLFDPDCTLSDGAAAAECPAIFDIDNVPAWDTWVLYLADRTERRLPWRPFRGALACWVPRQLVADVDRGIRVNPEQCIAWADEIDTWFTRMLCGWSRSGKLGLMGF